MEDEFAYITVDLENNTIRGKLNGKTSVIRKEMLSVGEDADIQMYLQDCSVDGDWSGSQFKLKANMAHKVWRTLVNNGWRG